MRPSTQYPLPRTDDQHTRGGSPRRDLRAVDDALDALDALDAIDAIDAIDEGGDYGVEGGDYDVTERDDVASFGHARGVPPPPSWEDSSDGVELTVVDPEYAYRGVGEFDPSDRIGSVHRHQPPDWSHQRGGSTPDAHWERRARIDRVANGDIITSAVPVRPPRELRDRELRDRPPREMRDYSARGELYGHPNAQHRTERTWPGVPTLRPRERSTPPRRPVDLRGSARDANAQFARGAPPMNPMAPNKRAEPTQPIQPATAASPIEAGDPPTRVWANRAAPTAAPTTAAAPNAPTVVSDCDTDDPWASGRRVDRYIVARRLGIGGMGVVYQAYDPSLHRHVALKLVRANAARPTSRRRARLIREAQAMAQVSHPNVITVYDVGVHDDDVFIAMELVAGQTLDTWLGAAPRTPDEIVAVFAAAGRGLAAAHAKGLVHRDFKPTNVIIGDDGRVRVLDFGLVCTAADRDSDARRPSSNQLLSEPLTVAGMVVGTPLYMAPEQHCGAPIDARSDQFGFCVALYHALVGERPFAEDDTRTYRAAVLDGDRRAVPPHIRLSPRIAAVLERGLATSPDARYPSMDALVADLDPDPQPVRRPRAKLTALLAAVAVIFGIGFAAQGRELVAEAAGPSCDVADDALAGAWDEAVSADLKRAFAATGHRDAARVHAAVARAVDDYAARWRQTRRAACEATYARDDEPVHVLHHRERCLDRRRDKLAALVDVLSEPDASVIERAADAAAALPDPAACLGPEALGHAVHPPRDPGEARRRWAMRRELDTAWALREVGRLSPARTRAQAVVAQLERAGQPGADHRADAERRADHRADDEHSPRGHDHSAPLAALAEALLLLGSIERRDGAPSAEATLYRAAEIAAAAAADRLVAASLVEQLELVASAPKRRAEAATLIRAAQIAVARAASPDLRGRLDALRDGLNDGAE